MNVRIIRFSVACVGLALLALGGLHLRVDAAGAASIKPQPPAECATACAPPDGGLPGLHPPRLVFGDGSARCDGTEPEFSAAAGIDQLARADYAHPSLWRTYTWYTRGNDPTPIPWIAHCDVRWSTQVQFAAPRIAIPEILTTNATVPVRVTFPSAPAGDVVRMDVPFALPRVDLPRRADGTASVVQPSAVITNLEWNATNGCEVRPLPEAPMLAVAILPSAASLPCVQANVTWQLSAVREITSGPARGTREPVNTFIDPVGRECQRTCEMRAADAVTLATMTSAASSVTPSPNASNDSVAATAPAARAISAGFSDRAETGTFGVVLAGLAIVVGVASLVSTRLMAGWKRRRRLRRVSAVS